MLAALKKIWSSIRNFNPEKYLERLIEYLDSKREGLPEEVTPSEDAKPRQPFDRTLPEGVEHSINNHTWGQRLRLLGTMPFMFYQMLKSGRYYDDPIDSAPRKAPPEFFERLEELAREHGAADVGYVRDIRDDEVFEGKSVPARHAVVFICEMDRKAWEGAPSFEAFHEVVRGYHAVGKVANEIADHLIDHEYQAYPGTSLGGLTDYVAVAERAGLGASGYHGLLIAPEVGARLRINMVFTDVPNLPDCDAGEHAWVRDFCDQCQKCVRSCPPQAIHDEPRQEVGTRKTCIDYEACYDYFAANHGCGVCLSVCPFSNAGYDKIKEGFRGSEDQDSTVIGPDGESGRGGPRVAVVGAGPAGFYATEALLEQAPDASVDIVEKLPAPYGLVRYGVAPEHPEVKSKARVFDEIFEDDCVRFLGNVKFGEDLTRSEVQEHFDAVVYAVGASDDRKLGIPGEELPGSHSAREFVAWYNAHPEASDRNFRFDHSNLAVIGMGNVALDVTRMLAKPPDELDATDMAPYAVDTLRESQVTDVHIFARRGPSQAKFTPKELREVAELEGVDFRVDPEDLAADRRLAPESEVEARRMDRNLELFESFAGEVSSSEVRLRVHLRFFRSPVRIVGCDGRVGGLELAASRLEECEGRLSARRTAERIDLDCGTVMRSIGYRTAPLPDVPFDADRGVIPNRSGRMVDEEGSICPGEYVSGWARRGPTGVIGTNKADAREVVAHLLKDWPDLQPARAPEPAAVDAILEAKGVRRIDAGDWQRLRRLEHRRGSREQRRAVKFVEVDEMLRLLDEHPAGHPAVAAAE